MQGYRAKRAHRGATRLEHARYLLAHLVRLRVRATARVKVRARARARVRA